MHKAGICLADAICLSTNSRKHTRHISKPCTVMGAIRRFGARSVYCTTRSTSTEMRLMHTLAPFASTQTFPRSGTTWALWYDHYCWFSLQHILITHSMSLATIRLVMHWTHTSVPLSSTRRIRRSRLDCNCFAAVKVVGQMVKTALQYLKTCNLITTPQLELHQMDHQHNGEVHKVLVN